MMLTILVLLAWLENRSLLILEYWKIQLQNKCLQGTKYITIRWLSQNRKNDITKYLYNDQQIKSHFRIDYQNDDLNDATAEVDQKLYFRVVTPDSIRQTYENDMAQTRQARFDSGTTGGSKIDVGNRLWSTW